MGLSPVSEPQVIPYRLSGKSNDFSDTFYSTVSCTLSSDVYETCNNKTKMEEAKNNESSFQSHTNFLCF